MLSGAQCQTTLVGQSKWESLEKAMIPIRCADPFEVKNATVLTADIICDNGEVHVIDRVILPG